MAVGSTDGDVQRDYFAVTTHDHIFCVLYFDYHQEAYYIARVYD